MVCGITLAQGRIRGGSGQISHSSPQLRTANEKGNFECPDSSQTTRLLYVSTRSGNLYANLFSFPHKTDC